ncbi:hypothetical protein VTK73DRAFT_7434 [Phialemonium thermophilum]|uniref:Uncharacterized protein n=1 Tax=Phialemonium thermophilum TaxID=223376 RepID=A0ABR3WF60_9PEZI
MMAALGDSFIDHSYPGLDTWRRSADGKGVVHNTSGATRNRPFRGCVMEEPNPQGVGMAPTQFAQRRVETGEEKAPQEGRSSKALLLDQGGTLGDSDCLSGATLEPGPSFSPQEEEDEGAEIETAESASTPVIRHKAITTKMTKRGGKLFYEDYKGNRRETSRSEWQAGQNGFLLQGKHHNYFVKKFP